MKKLWKSIINFLRYKKEPATIPPVKPIEILNDNKKYNLNSILIVVGHTKASGGTTTYLGEGEYDYNCEVAEIVKQEIKALNPNCEVMIQKRDVGGLRGAYSRGNKILPELTIELHLNAFSKKAYGLEVLAMKDDTNSIIIADIISDEVASAFDFIERKRFKEGEREVDGVLRTSKGDNGHYNLQIAKDYTTAPYRVLIEPTFVNIKTHESEKIVPQQGKIKYAKTLAKILVELW